MGDEQRQDPQREHRDDPGLRLVEDALALEQTGDEVHRPGAEQDRRVEEQVEAHEKAYCDQLDKLGMEVDAIPYDKVIPFGGALHCTTLDINRVGGCEDYFPNQIPGY